MTSFTFDAPRPRPHTGNSPVVTPATKMPALRPTLRALVSKPSYFVVSVVVLGVSIAAQLALFAVVDGMLLRPPSAQRPGELAFVRSSLPSGRVSYPDFRDLQERSTSFAATFSYFVSNRTALEHEDQLRTTRIALVSGSYFPALGVGGASGRLLGPDDDRDNAAPVAVITADLSRQQRIGVGAIVRVNTHPFTVVGILPDGFRGIERNAHVEVYVPWSQLAVVQPKWVLTNRGYQSTTVAARLKPDVSLEQANAELGAIGAQLQQENPKHNYGMTLRAVSFVGFRYALDSGARAMVLVAGLVWLLFALAATNFFALTLLRLLERRRELAVRVALGATTGDLGRELLAELLCVSAAAVAWGVGLGWALLAWLKRDPNVAALVEASGIALDARALAAAGAALSVAVLGVWLLAWRRAARVDLAAVIKEGGSAPRRKAAFAGLFAVQFAIALFLVAVALGFGDALRALASRTHPFRTENLLLFDANFRHLGVAGERRVAFIDSTFARLRDVPGVTHVGASSSAPLGGAGWTNIIVDERDPALAPDKCFVHRSVVTPDFFGAAGIRLLHGRQFEEAETRAGVNVALVNAAAARRHWPDGALGKTFRPWVNGPVHTVVGVVDDVPVDASGKVLPQIFTPWVQAVEWSLVVHVAVRQDNAATRAALTGALRDVWPRPAPPALRPVQAQIGTAAADFVTAVRVVLGIAGFATLVTSCGLYFFSAYTAAQTLRDSAIRRALGAQTRDMVWSHLARYRLGLAGGAALGLGLLAWLAPRLETVGPIAVPMRYGYVVAALAVLLAIALAGLCLPLRRVVRADLARTLHQGG